MRLKSLLIAIAATLVILPSCNKKDDVKNPTKDDDKPATNEFTTRLNTLESYMGMTSQALVDALAAEGFTTAEAAEGKINASDSINGIVCTVYATVGASDKVNYLTYEMVAADAKSYVADASKLAETIRTIGQNHNLPSGVALVFNDYSYTKGEESIPGYDWTEMENGLADLGSTSNAVMNWKSSGGIYGRLSLIRNVVEENTSVKYLLQDYTFN